MLERKSIANIDSSKIKEVLDALTVEELSFFVRFKLKSYLPDTQNQIIQYIERNRGGNIISVRSKVEKQNR